MSLELAALVISYILFFDPCNFKLMASLKEHFIDRRLKELDPFLEFQDVWKMFIILLFDESEPVYFADSMIVTIVTILSFVTSSLNITVNEIFLVPLFDPFALLNQVKQELSRKEPLINCVVDSDRQITGATLTLDQSLDVCLNQVGDIV
jgi:hypothetical protein